MLPNFHSISINFALDLSRSLLWLTRFSQVVFSHPVAAARVDKSTVGFIPSDLAQTIGPCAQRPPLCGISELVLQLYLLVTRFGGQPTELVLVENGLLPKRYQKVQCYKKVILDECLFLPNKVVIGVLVFQSYNQNAMECI